MNSEVFITCAVTGVGDDQPDVRARAHDAGQIAEAALEAAPRRRGDRAHPRPRSETGGPSRDPALFREVVERIRSSEVDVV